MTSPPLSIVVINLDLVTLSPLLLFMLLSLLLLLLLVLLFLVLLALYSSFFSSSSPSSSSSSSSSLPLPWSASRNDLFKGAEELLLQLLHLLLELLVEPNIRRAGGRREEGSEHRLALLLDRLTLLPHQAVEAILPCPIMPSSSPSSTKTKTQMERKRQENDDVKQDEEKKGLSAARANNWQEQESSSSSSGRPLPQHTSRSLESGASLLSLALQHRTLPSPSRILLADAADVVLSPS